MSNTLILIMLAALTVIIASSPLPSILIPLYFLIPTILIRLRYRKYENFSIWQNIISVIQMYISSMFIAFDLAARNLDPNPKVKLASRYTCAILIYGFIICYEHYSHFKADITINLAISVLPLLVFEYHIQSYKLTYREILIEYPKEKFFQNPKSKK